MFTYNLHILWSTLTNIIEAQKTISISICICAVNETLRPEGCSYFRSQMRPGDLKHWCLFLLAHVHIWDLKQDLETWSLIWCLFFYLHLFVFEDLKQDLETWSLIWCLLSLCICSCSRSQTGSWDLKLNLVSSFSLHMFVFEISNRILIPEA